MSKRSKSDNCPHRYRHCTDADARSAAAACRECRVPLEKVVREREVMSCLITHIRSAETAPIKTVHRMFLMTNHAPGGKTAAKAVPLNRTS